MYALCNQHPLTLIQHKKDPFLLNKPMSKSVIMLIHDNLPGKPKTKGAKTLQEYHVLIYIVATIIV